MKKAISCSLVLFLVFAITIPAYAADSSTITPSSLSEMDSIVNSIEMQEILPGEKVEIVTANGSVLYVTVDIEDVPNLARASGLQKDVLFTIWDKDFWGVQYRAFNVVVSIVYNDGINGKITSSQAVYSNVASNYSVSWAVGYGEFANRLHMYCMDCYKGSAYSFMTFSVVLGYDATTGATYITSSIGAA